MIPGIEMVEQENLSLSVLLLPDIHVPWTRFVFSLHLFTTTLRVELNETSEQLSR